MSGLAPGIHGLETVEKLSLVPRMQRSTNAVK